MKHEIQIHAAVSRIGHKLAIHKEERQDKEICQFAVAYPARFDGDIKLATVNAAFENLKQACIKKMRESGMLAGGE
jgi:hypothetical protein